MTTRYAIVPIFYKQSTFEQLMTSLFGATPVAEEPIDLSYIGALCDDKKTAECLIAAVHQEKGKWVGPVKRYEIVSLQCVFPDETLQPLSEYLYLEKQSLDFDKIPRIFTPEKIKNISPKLVEMGLVRFRKNLYYHEGLINASENYPYTAPYFNSSVSTNSVGADKSEELDSS